MVSTGPSLRSRQRYPTSLQAATMDSAAIAAATSLRTRERIAMMRGGMGGSIRNLDASFTNHQDAHGPRHPSRSYKLFRAKVLCTNFVAFRNVPLRFSLEYQALIPRWQPDAYHFVSFVVNLSLHASETSTIIERASTRYGFSTAIGGPSSSPTASSGDGRAVSTARRQGRPEGEAGIRKVSGSQ